MVYCSNKKERTTILKESCKDDTEKGKKSVEEVAINKKVALSLAEVGYNFEANSGLT